MSIPNHLISEVSTNEDGSVTITYYAIDGGDDFTALTHGDTPLVSNTGMSRGEIHQRNMSPEDGDFHILQSTYDTEQTFRDSMDRNADDTRIYHQMRNGMAFMNEIPYTTITTGMSTQDTDFKADDPNIPVVGYDKNRGGATAFHDRGQATVNLMIRTNPDSDMGARVANLVIQAACDALMDVDTDGVLGKVANIPEVPGIWTHTETDNPLKVGVAGGHTSFFGPERNAHVNAMALVNIEIDLSTQNSLIIPCGLPDKPLVDLSLIHI